MFFFYSLLPGKNSVKENEKKGDASLSPLEDDCFRLYSKYLLWPDGPWGMGVGLCWVVCASDQV